MGQSRSRCFYCCNNFESIHENYTIPTLQLSYSCRNSCTFEVSLATFYSTEALSQLHQNLQDYFSCQGPYEFLDNHAREINAKAEKAVSFLYFIIFYNL